MTKWQKILLMVWITPGCWLAIIPAVYSSPYWILLGACALWLRLLVSAHIYLSHTVSNAQNATDYFSRLRQSGYQLELAELSDLFPQVAERYQSFAAIYVVVVRPTAGMPPLTHYCAYTMPALNVAITFISDHPDELGDVLYFQALHEVGHALATGRNHTLNQFSPLINLWVLYFPIFLMVPSLPFQLITILLAFWHWKLEAGLDFAEVSADQFAIQAFDITRGVEAREIALQSMMGYWSGRKTPEILERTFYLKNECGYAPELPNVKVWDHGRYLGLTHEVSLDQLGVQILSRINRGPVLLSQMLVFAFYGLSLGRLEYEPYPYITVSCTCLLPVFFTLLLGLFLSFRKIRRQYLNIALMLATSTRIRT